MGFKLVAGVGMSSGLGVLAFRLFWWYLRFGNWSARVWGLEHRDIGAWGLNFTKRGSLGVRICGVFRVKIFF